MGTCAAFGGIPHANPNPTGAVPVSEIIKDKPIINVSGCPPIPVVITGVLTHYLTFGTIPELDSLGRPLAFFGDSIHDRCYRRPFYDQANSPRLLMMKVLAVAGVCTNSVARDRRRIMPAPP